MVVPALATAPSQRLKFFFQTHPEETRMAASTGDDVGLGQEATALLGISR